MTLAVTGLYAALLAALYLVLTARVIRFRRGAGVSLGDGDDPVLRARIRAHGNFAEYAPIGLILLLIAEVQATPAVWLHVLGALLLAGRLLHGINFSFGLRRMPLRVGGMVLTLLALGLGGVLALPL
jgi:uncharacterized membrane protein YecN with MAPEG domain